VRKRCKAVMHLERTPVVVVTFRCTCTQYGWWSSKLVKRDPKCPFHGADRGEIVTRMIDDYEEIAENE